MGAQQSALLVMDLQGELVEALNAEDTVGRVRQATDAAHEAGVPVVFVRVAFRSDHRDVSRRNKRFSQLAEAGRLIDGSPGADFHPDVDVREDDSIVTKRRISAFANTDLPVLLRSLDVSSLALCGIATSGVVLSTLRQAADLDYELTVLRDGCSDANPEVDNFLMEHLFPTQAEVISINDFVVSLAQ